MSAMLLFDRPAGKAKRKIEQSAEFCKDKINLGLAEKGLPDILSVIQNLVASQQFLNKTKVH